MGDIGLIVAGAVLVLLFWTACVYSAALLAEYKGYDRIWGIKAGLVLGALGVLIFSVLPPRGKPASETLSSRKLWDTCPNCGTIVEVYDGFCTKCGALMDEPIEEREIH